MQDGTVTQEVQKRTRFEYVFVGIFGVVVLGIGVASVVPWRPGGSDGPKVEGVAPELSSNVIAPEEKERVVIGTRPQRAQQPEAEPAREVTLELTPMGEQELARLLQRAHEDVFGKPPHMMRLSVAWAHLALEHSRGSEIYCNNYGNLIANDSGPFYRLQATERTRKNAKAALGEWRNMTMRFRAYSSPRDGAAAYWRLIHEKYTAALAYFDNGNGYLAGRKLAEAGYMTAEAQPYAHSLGSLQEEFLTRIWPELQ